ncbi:efflux RND transporter periplasmic adaptor subunit [Noviherbaspirillum pedocola]|uniref:Metal transporter n=1 Tax=Noviherbaspirillum pedocola TaxID=2801341 RepID=A0A934SZP0_9BURK|nr:metal transporter [Noviherbaspirillum pedocola]MBK4734678.1 metal transporter [Noviherbaspirillum pedocola]
MKSPTKTVLKGLLLLSPTILALLLLGGYWLSKGEQNKEAEREAPVPSSTKIEVRNGIMTLIVNEATQERSGIQAQALGDATATGGPAVYGTVIDMQPLVELSGRYASAISDLSAAKTERATTKAELARVIALYADEQNVSQKVVGAARAADAAATSKVKIAAAAADAVVATLRQQFGATIAEWTASPSSRDLASLFTRREVLARIVLGRQPGPAPKTLTLFGNDQFAHEAHLVSPSPQTDPNIQGQAYLYRVAASLPTGTRVTAYIGGQKQSRLDIPAPAIVWYGGQPWAYVKTTPTTFERRAINGGIPRNGDFLVSRGFTAGEQVVIRGAQLLLSEESRSLLSND